MENRFRICAVTLGMGLALLSGCHDRECCDECGGQIQESPLTVENRPVVNNAAIREKVLEAERRAMRTRLKEVVTHLNEKSKAQADRLTALFEKSKNSDEFVEAVEKEFPAMNVRMGTGDSRFQKMTISMGEFGPRFHAYYDAKTKELVSCAISIPGE
jgi:putative NIF3 family GTP cyclohydrolase 1 type 2